MPGTQIYSWPANQGANQRWRLFPVGEDGGQKIYKYVSLSSNALGM